MAQPDDEILRIVREVLVPLFRADGGKVYVVALASDAVALHLGGTYSGCPGNTLATRRVIEPAIQAVAPGTRVTVTSGALIPPGARLIGD